MARQTSQRSRSTATKHSQHAASAVDDAVRHQLIAEQAWLIAEQRGFDGEHELDDWLEAESIIDARLAARH